MAQVSEQGLALIRRFEGCRLTAYKCPAGVMTIGYGRTGTMDGQSITEGVTITQEKAEALLREDVARFAKGVEDLLSRPATQGQYDAMVSLAFNIGINGFRESTVRARFNAGQIPGAAEAFILWVKAKGMMLEGLVRRRAAEIVRFMS